MQSTTEKMENSKTAVKKVLGIGCWVQGFRCFPWMAVMFFLKDNLSVDPYTLQLLQNSANLPMVGKPLYGIVSDAVYVAGQHRLPYIAIGALFQAISWLAIAIFSRSHISVFTISSYLLLSNLGASFTEVANDAIVAETGKQPSSSGDIQSYVWIATSVGGLLGNLLGGIFMDKISPQAMFLIFGILTTIQFLFTLSVRESSLNLPKKSSGTGIRKQLSNITLALQKPEIVCSIMWFAASYAVIPALTGTMFFYQTEYLKIDSSVLGISKVFGQAAILLWSIIYNRYLKLVPPRKLISAIQAMMAMFMLSDVLFVKGFFRDMGLPDSIYVIIFSGLLEVLYFFKILPFSVLIAQLCPPGCEGSLMAFLASAISLAMIVSGYFGVALASYVGITGSNFSGFPVGLAIQAVCTLIPLCWSSFIPDGEDAKTMKKKL